MPALALGHEPGWAVQRGRLFGHPRRVQGHQRWANRRHVAVLTYKPWCRLSLSENQARGFARATAPVGASKWRSTWCRVAVDEASAPGSAGP